MYHLLKVLRNFSCKTFWSTFLVLLFKRACCWYMPPHFTIRQCTCSITIHCTSLHAIHNCLYCTTHYSQLSVLNCMLCIVVSTALHALHNLLYCVTRDEQFTVLHYMLCNIYCTTVHACKNVLSSTITMVHCRFINIY